MKNVAEFKPICIHCHQIEPWHKFYKSLNQDLSTGTCSKCQGLTVLVDSLFIPIAKILWNKGYATTYSCLGHCKKDCGYYNRPYVGFKDISKITTIPKNWTKDENSIRYKKNSPTHAFKYLLEWAKSLPKLQTDSLLKPEPKPIENQKYNSQIIFFMGKKSFNKVYKKQFSKYKVLTKITKVADLRKYKNVIIMAKDLAKWALILEAHAPFSKDQNAIIVFELNNEREDSMVPAGVSGWGAFKSKAIYGLFKLWIKKYSPQLKTGDGKKTYSVPYVVKS